MSHVERLLTLSSAVCCVCDHSLSVQELDEFRGRTDECLNEVYCRTCLEEHVMVCRECSVRFTSDGICEECASREYALAV